MPPRRKQLATRSGRELAVMSSLNSVDQSTGQDRRQWPYPVAQRVSFVAHEHLPPQVHRMTVRTARDTTPPERAGGRADA